MDRLPGLPLLPTAIVGSYPQPDWLIDREKLKGRLPPRVRARELWRIPQPWLADAQEAATLVAISDQKLAGNRNCSFLFDVSPPNCRNSSKKSAPVTTTRLSIVNSTPSRVP